MTTDDLPRLRVHRPGRLRLLPEVWGQAGGRAARVGGRAAVLRGRARAHGCRSGRRSVRGGRPAAGHRPVRGPGGIHRALGVARPGGGPRPPERPVPGALGSDRALRRVRREVRWRRGHGRLRRAPRARGRSRARAPRRPPDARARRRAERTVGAAGRPAARPPHRREHGPGGGRHHRRRIRGRLRGDRRHRQHRITAPERRTGRRDPGEPDHAGARKARIPPGAGGRVRDEGQEPAARGVPACGGAHGPPLRTGARGAGAQCSHGRPGGRARARWSPPSRRCSRARRGW